MEELTVKKLVTFTTATVLVCDMATQTTREIDVELAIKARDEKDFAKWYKRCCGNDSQRLVRVSNLRFIKRKYEISVRNLIVYGKEVDN